MKDIIIIITLVLFAGIICQTIEREVDYSTAKKLLFWLLFSGKSIQSIIAPSSAGIRPVVNRLN